MMEGPGDDSEEKREPASDIDTAVVKSLKELDLDGRLEMQTSSCRRNLQSQSKMTHVGPLPLVPQRRNAGAGVLWRGPNFRWKTPCNQHSR